MKQVFIAEHKGWVRDCPEIGIGEAIVFEGNRYECGAPFWFDRDGEIVRVVPLVFNPKAGLKPTCMSHGPQKIKVIKAIREISGWGLKEAKVWSETLPHPVAELVSEDRVQIAVDMLRAQGAEVEGYESIFDALASAAPIELPPLDDDEPREVKEDLAEGMFYRDGHDRFEITNIDGDRYTIESPFLPTERLTEAEVRQRFPGSWETAR